MKVFVLICFTSTFFAGCASHESGRVSYKQDGTKVYGLDDQPQSAIVAEGPLMVGAYDSHAMPTGQFTGKERTQDSIGQQPVTPREADARDMSRTPRQVGTGIVLQGEGTGAGSLGQTGIRAGESISSSTIMAGPSNPSLNPSASVSSANPATIESAPTLAQPLTRGSINQSDSISALGSAPGIETSRGAGLSNNSLGVPGRNPAATLAPTVGQPGTLNTSTPDLADRIRNVLKSGRSDTITHLTPDRLQDFEIEAVNGDVTLRGTVRSNTEKMMIGNKVGQIDGVRSVNNQLRVVSPTREGMEDLHSPGERANPLHQEK